MEPTDVTNPTLAEAQRLAPMIRAYHKKTLFVRTANLATAIMPSLLVGAAVLGASTTSITELLIGAGFMGACAVQHARWQKAALKKEFESLWRTADENVRPFLLGYLREAFDRRVSKSPNVVSRDDFNLRNRHALMTVVPTALMAAYYAPIAPVMFFTGVQTREFGDSAHLESAARHTLIFYDQLINAPR